MSQLPSISTSSKNFETIFSAALKVYKKQTKKDIASHPLATELQSCDSSSAILAVLRAQVQIFDQSQGADENLTKWLDPTVNVLFAFSATLGNGVGVVNCKISSRSRSPLTCVQVFPPANAIFAGIGVLLQVSVLLYPRISLGNSRYSLRPLRMSALPRMLLSTCLVVLNTFLSGLRHI